MPNNDYQEFTCDCGKVYTTLEKLKHHKRYYCRPPDDEDDVCKLCDRQFKSYAGVRQHMRRAHPVEYNEGLQGEDRRRHRPWAAMENLALARAELAYGGTNINKHLSTLFPDRTLEMIKSHRRCAEYRSLRDRIRVEVEDAADDVPILGVPALSPEPPVAHEETFLYNVTESVASDPPVAPNSVGPMDPVSPPVVHVPDPCCAPAPVPLSPPGDCVRQFLNELIARIELPPGWILPVQFIFDPSSTVELLQGSIDRLWGLAVGGGSNRGRVRRGGQVDPPSLDNRKKRYAFAQRLYKKDRSRLAEGLLAGTLYSCPSPAFSVDVAWEAYDHIFGSPSPRDEEFISDPVDHDILIYRPITAGELRKFLQARQSDARGPDGIGISCLRRLSQDELLVLFNLILFSSTIPSDWRLNRTILIPKSGGNGEDVNTWRPLTVSSAGLRLFNKIMAARFSELPLCNEQRGFRSIDGTLANTIALQAIIKHSRANAKPYSISTLDLRRAFDTVSHDSVIRAMNRFRLHPKIVNLVRDNFRDCSTTIDVRGVTTRPIKMNRGVKQGDPLSPILFNLVMDEAIQRLRESGAGLNIGDARVTCLAYADDLLLCTENKSEMQRAIRLLQREFQKRGMSLNAAKCSNLTCQLLPNKSKLYVVTRPTLAVEGSLIKQIDVTEQLRYLGYNYGFMGAKVSSVDCLQEQLGRVVGAPLKPQQKLNIIKTYLIPRFIYMLQSPAITLRTLSSVDRSVRLAIKRILHLPKQTANAVLYAPTKHGGLGVFSFRDRIPAILLRRIEGLRALNDDRILASTLSLEYIHILCGNLNKWCLTAGKTPEQISSFWACRLEASVCGGGIWQVGLQGGGRGSVDNPPHWWSGEDYIKNILLRYNLLPTRGGLHNRSGDTACRAGCQRRETLCHVLQACPVTHFERIRRHDYIVAKLRDMALAGGLQVDREPRIRDAGGALHIPDLVFRRASDVMVTDVAVHWEGPDTLTVSGGHKIARYSGPPFLDAVSARYPGCRVRVVPFILGARGGWCPLNNELVRWLGLTRSQVDLVLSSVVRGGWIIHSSFSARVWADHGG